MLQLVGQTKESLLSQGLGPFEDVLYLIPECMISEIPNGTTLESILGDKVVFMMNDGVPNIDTVPIRDMECWRMAFVRLRVLI